MTEWLIPLHEARLIWCDSKINFNFVVCSYYLLFVVIYFTILTVSKKQVWPVQEDVVGDLKAHNKVQDRAITGKIKHTNKTTTNNVLTFKCQC